jgi:hypothetical protein
MLLAAANVSAVQGATKARLSFSKVKPAARIAENSAGVGARALSIITSPAGALAVAVMF